jgi:hypothetical protein
MAVAILRLLTTEITKPVMEPWQAAILVRACLSISEERQQDNF